MATRRINGDIILPNRKISPRERKKEMMKEIWELGGSVIIGNEEERGRKREAAEGKRVM